MRTFFFLLLSGFILQGWAQQDMRQSMEEHHHEHGDTANREGYHHDEKDLYMPSFFSSYLPMSRDGSGTSWQPDVSPTFMHMVMKRKTSFMFHENIFLRYNMQDINHESNRGGNKLDAPNMFMFAASQNLNEKNILSLHTMFSFDPLTVGKAGYPLLFQTGESYNGIPLIDKQHPHDLFSELSLNYTHSFSKNMDVNTYFGYPGEPALGPVAFMHRASAINNPDAPLGHHWQDATHISFGAGTLGLRYKNVKFEGSIFSGREPDENRYDFDKPKFDSYSWRISANPNKNISFQLSQGSLRSPEELKPTENIKRTTASITHAAAKGTDRFISTSLSWGMNSSEKKNLHSVLLESNLKLIQFSIYARYEFVQKDKEELQILSLDGNPIYNIQAFSLGISKTLFPNYIAHISVGAQGTIDFPDDRLRNIYGDFPLSAEVYLKISPPPGHMHHY